MLKLRTIISLECQQKLEYYYESVGIAFHLKSSIINDSAECLTRKEWLEELLQKNMGKDLHPSNRIQCSAHLTHTLDCI